VITIKPSTQLALIKNNNMELTTSTIWQKSKLLIKGLIIGVLILLLLVPAFFVKNLIKEREERQKEAVTEVSSKWAGRQTITGPVLVIPYEEKVVAGDNVSSVRKLAYFLPDKLDIKAKANPEKKYRGIYEVMLYSSTSRMDGRFDPLPLTKLKLLPAEMLWSEAYLCMNISDARGLKDEINVQWNDTTVAMSPTAINNALFREGFSSPVVVTQTDAEKTISFSANINVNGSEQLLFTPVGKETNVELQSAWPDPSFTGTQLPLTSDIKDSGFVAKWKSLAHTRGFPQQWKHDSTGTLQAYSFGADLIIPVNSYQKTMRSVKYAILCILLTFTAFFLIETSNKKSVHPVQYALIGFALILFYTLLLSFSEYTGFNTAYCIAAVATAGLIGWFVKGLLGSVKLSMLLSVVLVLLYSYVFTILQLQDYALLMGSIGLFLTLAVVMHFSKRIQW
jgi:inner membrane protein